MRILWEKALYIFKNEGLVALIRKTIPFLIHQPFFYRKYHLRRINLGQIYDLDIPPMPEDYYFHVITSNSQVSELTAEGYIFHPWYPTYRYRLDKGAVVFCVFVGKELGHISWCAMTAEAARILGEPPMKVDFTNNELVTGDYWTSPKYRGKGLATYATRDRRLYLLNKGNFIERSAMAVDNVAVHRIPRGHSSLYAIGRYMKILWWQSWKETSVEVNGE